MALLSKPKLYWLLNDRRKRRLTEPAGALPVGYSYVVVNGVFVTLGDDYLIVRA